MVPLEAKMRRDGIQFESTDQITVGGTKLTIIPHHTGSISDIDSCLLIQTNDYCVINMNDCIWDKSFYKFIDSIAKNYRDSSKNIIGLFSFTSAGPYPPYYWNDNELQSKLILTKAISWLYLNKIRKSVSLIYTASSFLEQV